MDRCTLRLGLQKSRSTAYLVLFCVLVPVAQVRAAEPAEPVRSLKRELVDDATRQKLMAYLEDVNQWIMTLDVGSGSLKNTKDTTDSIFINGNFARVLMASYRMTGNKVYLAESLRWCDNLYAKQQISITSKMEEGGYWPDMGYGRNIYFGDAGTAATALAMGYRLADSKRQAFYLQAMERYARFVMRGVSTDPQGKGRKATKTWVIAQGEDRGALGCGYYRGHLSVAPYTISTATTGGAFFSELFSITSHPKHKEVASGATKWLLKIRQPDGVIPYRLDGGVLPQWPLDTLAYCTEAFVTADTYLKDTEIPNLLRGELKPTVEWLIARQNADGSWGKLRSQDQQRSPRAVTLLSWYYRRFDPDPKIAESVRQYCRFLLDPENSQAYGVKELVRTTGFVGLAVAEIIAAGSTF